METPSDFDVKDVTLDADDPGIRSVFRVSFFVCLVALLALVPFSLSWIDSGATKADTADREIAEAGTMLSWAPKDDADRKTYVIDRYTLTLSTHIHGNGERVPHLRVRAPTGETTTLHGEVGYSIPSAAFGVGRLDPKSATHQVIFTSYTGGLHCCTKITVLDLVEGKWRRLELGLWDGDPLTAFPDDVDGDGAPDFVLKDDRFDYAFAPYTERHKPPLIFNIENARVVNVGREARYDKIFEAEMNHAHSGCVKGKNAACAAFVASASRLGKRPWAWWVMLKHYRRATDWDFPTKCKVARVNDLCPPGQSEQFREFPDALAWFLTDTGYTKP